MLTAPSTIQYQSWRHSLVANVLGLLLVAAGLLKFFSQHSFGRDITWYVLCIGEVLLGLWLIIGVSPRWARRTALACYFVFALASASKALGGEKNCGCFGSMSVSPWVMFGVDFLAIAALVFTSFLPPPPHPLCQRRVGLALTCESA